MDPQQLKTEIMEAIHAELRKFQGCPEWCPEGFPKGQLQVAEPVTIETAQPEDVLSDGCVVVARCTDLILIAAPASTEVCCKWTPEFSEVFESLGERGFVPCQWHVPSVKELQLAHKNCQGQFPSTYYWAGGGEGGDSPVFAHYVNMFSGSAFLNYKTNVACVRAFRWVAPGALALGGCPG